MSIHPALFSSNRMDWCTPQDFFDRLDAEFHFVLDAAATARSAKCRKYYTPEMDGLKQSWDCGGLCFAIRLTEGKSVNGYTVQSLEARMAPPSWIEKALNRLYQLTDEEVKRKND